MAVGNHIVIVWHLDSSDPSRSAPRRAACRSGHRPVSHLPSAPFQTHPTTCFFFSSPPASPRLPRWQAGMAGVMLCPVPTAYARKGVTRNELMVPHWVGSAEACGPSAARARLLRATCHVYILLCAALCDLRPSSGEPVRVLRQSVGDLTPTPTPTGRGTLSPPPAALLEHSEIHALRSTAPPLSPPAGTLQS